MSGSIRPAPLAKSMVLIVMVESDFEFESSMYLTGRSQFDTMWWRILEWALKVLISILRFWSMSEPSMVPDWSSNMYLAHNLKDSKSMVKIRQKLKQWILMIKHSISKIWDILNALMMLDWSFRVHFDYILKDSKWRAKIFWNMIW